MYYQFEDGFTLWYIDLGSALEYCEQNNTRIVRELPQH
jgi:hypothetical protein